MQTLIWTQMKEKKPANGVLVEIYIADVRLGEAQPAMSSVQAYLTEKNGVEYFQTVGGLLIKSNEVKQWADI